MHDICPKNTFPRILGAIPGSKAESERTQPQYELRDHGEHCVTTYGHNHAKYILLMRLLTLLYSISTDAYACESPKFSFIKRIILNNNGFDIILPGSHNPDGIPGLEIPQSRIPGLGKRVRDWNPYNSTDSALHRHRFGRRRINEPRSLSKPRRRPFWCQLVAIWFRLMELTNYCSSPKCTGFLSTKIKKKTSAK